MKKAAFAIFGSQGMAGSALVYYLRHQGYRVTAYDRQSFDITKDPVNQLDLDQIDYVVNAAGIINRRIASGTPEKETSKVNVTFPHQLADYCIKCNTKLIQISTDCVFDGLE
ncbi:sugar nucleotide-binding protein, partial [Magnetococcales bacterium HHB-1]